LHAATRNQRPRQAAAPMLSEICGCLVADWRSALHGKDIRRGRVGSRRERRTRAAPAECGR